MLSFFRLTEVARCLARTCSLSRWCTSDIGELLLCSGYFPFVFFINHRCVVGGPDILLLASTAEPSWATTHPATAVLLLLPLQVLPQQMKLYTMVYAKALFTVLTQESFLPSAASFSYCFLTSTMFTFRSSFFRFFVPLTCLIVD